MTVPLRNTSQDEGGAVRSADDRIRPSSKPLAPARSVRRTVLPVTSSSDLADDFSDLLDPPPEEALESSLSRSRKAKRSRKNSLSTPIWWAAGGMAALAVGIVVWVLWSPRGTAVDAAVALAEATSSPPAPLDYKSEIQPFFQQYCFDCHGPDTQEAGLELHRDQALADLLKNRQRWDKVYAHVKIGAMPPSSSSQPKPEERDKVVAWLDHTLHFVDCTGGADPGRVTIRRLNRAEYNNTVRDLVGVDFDPAQDFPADDVGYGFDNIGDVLSVQPLLVEKYLNAAEQIAVRAIPTQFADGLDRVISGQQMQASNKLTVNPLPNGAVILVTRGSVTAEVQIARGGEYALHIRSGATPFKPNTGGAQMELRVDGKPLNTLEVTASRDKTQNNELTVSLMPGKHAIQLAFLNDDYEKVGDKTFDRNLIIEQLHISGPQFSPDDLPPLQQALVQHRPSQDRPLAEAVRQNLKPLVRRAFRRPVNDGEIEPFVKVAQLAADRKESFERCMQIALQAVLVSPQFLFRVEDPVANGPQVRAVSDHELAVRLSYFLWSSMPDAELFQVAEQGKLNDDATLIAQVDRMLADPRSYAFVENFAGQWLALRKLNSEEVSPDPDLFPEWNEPLRADMATETKMFFASILRENQSLVRLLDARYSFVNERLAKLYGMPNVKGDEFRRVEFTDGRHAGVLTQASVLTLTSYPTRTSPVKRGEWILANILGDSPPPPPPVVPALEETQKSNPNLPFREQLILHRQDPGCAACHLLMDDLGFGFENFDAIGRWRDKDGPHSIDSSGVLPSGQKFTGPMELVTILKARQDDFARCLSEKLLTYALGRGLEYYDKCALDTIVEGVQRDQYLLTALVKQVALSEPFRKRRGEQPPTMVNGR
ncbi:MAG: DUF1592 domain-containing protein [Planctomycetota bacterium]|nr:MAG: DUF1592 domain-containing protein [Planctomycetota bacterium]